MFLADSIAGKLFRLIFSVYFLFTAVVTVIQLAAEYRNTEERFYAELNSAEATFRHGVDDAVWNYNRDGLGRILRGMLNVPGIIGVQTRDTRDRILGAAGVVPAADRGVGDLPAGARLLGEPPSNSLFSEFIAISFPTVYTDERGDIHPLGRWTVYSDRALIMERLEYRISSILLTSIIKALVLLVIFKLVVDRVLGAPLQRLRRELMALKDTPGPEARISLGLSGRDELALVEETLNATLERLRQSNQELRDLTGALERKVMERTVELQIANTELERLSETDPLTGLFNRRKIEAALQTEWRRHLRTGQPLAAIMLDVDHFKAFNDAYGHQAGDVCLRRVAQIIAAAVRRPGDLAARYGGEEFFILLPETSARGACVIAEEILKAVVGAAVPHSCSPTASTLTVSLGIYCAVPGDDKAVHSPDKLIDLADQALYVAKSAGRNCFRVLTLTEAEAESATATAG